MLTHSVGLVSGFIMPWLTISLKYFFYLDSEFYGDLSAGILYWFYVGISSHGVVSRHFS